MAAAEDLGRHVEGRAEDGGGVVVVCEQLGEAEVGDLDVAVVEEDVGELEVAVHDLVLDERLEGVEDLAEVLDDLVLRQHALPAHLGQHVAPVAVLQHEVVVVGRLLERVQLDDEGIVAGLQHLDLVLQQLVELACLRPRVPFMRYRQIDFTATSSSVSWCRPRNTSPNCPFPICYYSTYLSITLGINIYGHPHNNTYTSHT